MADYPICDALIEIASMHCAALVITENVVAGSTGLPTFAQPSDELRSGTITFIKYEGKVYGITCWHVIEIYRNYLKESGSKFGTTRELLGTDPSFSKEHGINNRVRP